jgi:hypothetical protein
MKPHSGAEAEKGRRITIDLTPAATDEVDRLRQITRTTTADLFRNAFSLLRLYIDARSRGQQLCVLDPGDENAARTYIELPIVVKAAKQSRSSTSERSQ